MKRMLVETEQVGNSAFDVEHLNRLAVLEMMESGRGDLEKKWEDIAGDEFDESGIYSPAEVGLGNWFASDYDD